MPNEYQHVAKNLIKLYKVDPKGAYRIMRTGIKDLFDMETLQGVRLEELSEHLRDEGYLLTPLDTADTSKAQVWVVQRIGRLEKLPMIDEPVGTLEDEGEGEK